ncbi:MAG: SirB2 family protein [Sulfuricella sp.]
MTYSLLKALHISCVITSYTLFFLRGFLTLREIKIPRQRWIRILPHAVDTLLLVSAIALAFTIHQYPFVNNWLTAKVVGLVLYIGLGSVALKYGKTKTIRLSAWLAAQGVFAYIVLAAIGHNPVPYIFQ